MQTILSVFTRDSARLSLADSLAQCDDRQLLDLGLVRAADGSLRLASDPTRPAIPVARRRPLKALLEGGLDVLGWLRRLPFRSQEWHPHFFLRE